MSQRRRELGLEIETAVSGLPNISEYQIEDSRELAIFRRKSVGEAASAIASAVGTAYAADAGFASSAARSAARAAQHFVTEQRFEKGPRADVSRFENESAWQIRRFVDVIWAGLHGEPYPSLESTE